MPPDVHFPRFSAAMDNAGIAPYVQNWLASIIDAQLARDLADDAKRMPICSIVERWRRWPDCGSPAPVEDTDPE